ncbi:MAG: GSCFA domain-containing protein [Flavobacteriales bacterium]|jgi:hypothetical protein|nr:GSCFA domain-containing protein [Flavobacteriales bacterium]
MKFSTKVEIKEHSKRINHRQKIAMIGSCFTNNIGNKLLEDQFDVSINPFGILFNPISVANAIKGCIDQKEFTAKDLLQQGEQWLSLQHHSAFNALTKEEILTNINDTIKANKDYYAKGSFLFITFGSAWIYTHLASQTVVANCHKIPQKQFTKSLLTVEELVKCYSSLLYEIREYNPNLNIVFTISPVRHWKDGVIENNQSKAVLHLAIMELVNNFDFVSYFPSYEIVLDELRDYRFYKADLLHPNQQAVDYIYERFSEVYYHTETQQLNRSIRKVKAALSHRPFNIDSKEHQHFLEKTKQKIEALKQAHPYLSF